jgi:hypothetical protein
VRASEYWDSPAVSQAIWGEGVREVCVICLCLVVVELFEFIVFVFVCGVAGYGIGDRVAKIEVEDNLACAV